jgi:uncharacterized membrane protein
MATDFGKTFERTPEGFQALAWALYVVSGLIAVATLGEISGMLLLIGCLVVIFLARSRRADAAQTIYASHFGRIATVMTVSLVVAIVLLAVTVATLGIGIIVTWPLYILYLLWLAYMLIRGMMKLNDGEAV